MKISTKVYLALIFALAIGAPVPSMGAELVSWEKVLEAGKKEGVVNAASSSLSGKAAVAVAKVWDLVRSYSWQNSDHHRKDNGGAKVEELCYGFFGYPWHKHRFVKECRVS